MTERILLAVTADVSLALMRGLPERFRDQGWEVHVVSSPGPNSRRLARIRGIAYHPIDMGRNPSFLGDLRALASWIALMRSVKPHVTSVGTPKAGLLGGIAAALVRVPRRIYVLRGLRYETSSGLARFALRTVERVACACAHEVLAVSHSLEELVLADRLVAREKLLVVGNGSSNGVDIERFDVTPRQRQAAKEDRWPKDPKTPVIGFIGRIHPDKGLDLLADAVALLAEERVNGRLVVVGGSDSDLGEQLKSRLRTSGFDVEFTGAVTDVAPHLRVMDLLCLPTKREGFPNVVIEAAAAGIPTVATLATGVPDAILHGKTGLICRTRDPLALSENLRILLQSEQARMAMGFAARQFVELNFERTLVQSNLISYYARRRRAVTHLPLISIRSQSYISKGPRGEVE